MRLRRFLFGVVPVLALVAGCGEAGGPFGGQGQAAPVQPRLETETPLQLQNVERVAAYKVIKAKPANLWAKAWIGPAGGTLSYYGFRIVVPAGAVDKVTMFTLSLPREGTERALAEFGPHNVEFAQPITIELPYAGTTSEGYAAAALWFDESTKLWTSVGGTLTSDGQRVQTQVWHFSTYGTAERGGTLTSSGG
ncbi:MAG TPA: hypothetical protein VF584_09900 [Longimicrobium sp.]|jgi:hypothetical protein